MIIEGHARRDDINQREAAVRQGSFQNRYQLLLISGKTARDESGSGAEGKHHRINGKRLVRFPPFALRSDIGRGRELPLGQSVYPIVLDEVDHFDIAADGVTHVPQPDRKRISIARYSDVGQGAELKPCAPLTK